MSGSEEAATTTQVSPSPRSITDPSIQTVISSPNKTYHPSPTAWEDQILYFLLPDRFAQGTENTSLDLTGNPSQGVIPPAMLVQIQSHPQKSPNGETPVPRGKAAH